MWLLWNKFIWWLPNLLDTNIHDSTDNISHSLRLYLRTALVVSVKISNQQTMFLFFLLWFQHKITVSCEGNIQIWNIISINIALKSDEVNVRIIVNLHNDRHKTKSQGHINLPCILTVCITIDINRKSRSNYFDLYFDCNHYDKDACNFKVKLIWPVFWLYNITIDTNRKLRLN